ncbi:MAG TPA: RNA polymerase factor sigma-54 [Burkholderiaceae bacterium]|nr:RNA polymerase factor sigma-54 [Burkholderiaceae bacterium]
MKQGLSLKVSQHLALTPQLQQSIRLLQLSTLELNQEVEQLLSDNPFLERELDEAPREEFGLAQVPDYARNHDAAFDSSYESKESYADQPSDDSFDQSWEAQDWDGDGSVDTSPNDYEWGTEATGSSAHHDANTEFDATELGRQHETLPMHLHRQASALRLSAPDSAALNFLIESLNENGYLDDSLASLVQSLDASLDIEQQEEWLHRFTVAQRLLQNMTPTGVGAHDLAECLSLQINAHLKDLNHNVDIDHAAARETCQVALCILQQPIDLLARRDLKKLAQNCRESESSIKTAIAYITRLEPKPGRQFANLQRNIIVPDVFVVPIARKKPSDAQQFRAQLNTDTMPRLRVHDIYANALKNHKGEGAGATLALQQRLQEARWFIKSIQQRFDTILRVSNAIIERQKGFLTHGELAMRPLVLREIADELGLHESTISRVTTAKYMQTPFGTYELKYFFGSGLGTDSGSNASSTAVRALIKQLVAAENPKKPLSDNKISQLLHEQGIDCARRTVAKYREALKIAPTNLRKLL